MNKFPVKYRDMKEGDESLIYSTWLKSYRNSGWGLPMSNDTFYLHHKAVIKSILDSSNTVVSIICDENDEDQIYGYAIATVVNDIAVIHFCYVKYNFRKLGLMKELIKVLGWLEGPAGTKTFITHLPRNFRYIKDKYDLEYNPYLLTLIGNKLPHQQ